MVLHQHGLINVLSTDVLNRKPFGKMDMDDPWICYESSINVV